MSKDNDRSRNTWGEDDESPEQPATFRDAYLDSVNQKRPRRRSSDTPQDFSPEVTGRPTGRSRPRGGTRPGSGRIYEEGNELPTRPRPTRQSRDEVYSRLRQRPHQPVYSRNREEVGSQPPPRTRKTGVPQSRLERADDYPSQVPVRRRMQQEAYMAPRDVPERASRNVPDPVYAEGEQYVEYDEYDEYQAGRRRKRPEPPRRRKQRRGGRVFANILIGCLGGIITLAVVVAVVAFLILHNTSIGQNLNLGKSTYTHQISQALTPGDATQLIVSNQVGSVSVMVDPKASSATLNGTKKVLATSSADANKQFGQITVTVKQIVKGDNPACTAGSCLLIATSVPASSSSFLTSGTSSSIDLTITLPPTFNSPTAPYTLAVNTTTGNIAVAGFAGILDLSGSIGNVNITVTNAFIFSGTCLQTTSGNITINQGSTFDLVKASPTDPCTNAVRRSGDPWFHVSSGKGSVAITLTSLSTNLLLDASTLNGKISDDFGLKINTDSASASSYNGPLVATSGSNPTALLYVSTSTGDIQLRKQ